MSVCEICGIDREVCKATESHSLRARVTALEKELEEARAERDMLKTTAAWSVPRGIHEATLRALASTTLGQGWLSPEDAAEIRQAAFREADEKHAMVVRLQAAEGLAKALARISLSGNDNTAPAPVVLEGAVQHARAALVAWRKARG